MTTLDDRLSRVEARVSLLLRTWFTWGVLSMATTVPPVDLPVPGSVPGEAPGTLAQSPGKHRALSRP